MADRSSIEWTDATWNPVTGCTDVSPGCQHCYARRITERFHGTGSFDRVRLHHDRVERPLSWRKPRQVFVNSMSDLLHADVPDTFVEDVFVAMALARQHTFQILTKRPGRARSLLSRPDFRDTVHHGCHTICGSDGGAGNATWTPDDWQWPLPNVWLGVSTEDQQWTDIRVPTLLETPAAVRFVSAEPLLGPIDLTAATGTNGVDWVIAGGESGPAARPMHPDWARSLRDQCHTAGVPFFFKQHGEWWPGAPSDDVWCHTRQHPWPDGQHTSYRIGKRRAGRTLDGATHDAYPHPPQEATR